MSKVSCADLWQPWKIVTQELDGLGRFCGMVFFATRGSENSAACRSRARYRSTPRGARKNSRENSRGGAGTTRIQRPAA